MRKTTAIRFLNDFLAGAVMLASAMSVQAACTQADIAGTWYIFGTYGHLWRTSMEETVRCKLRVGATGAIIATGSSCKFRVAETMSTVGSYTATVPSGTLRVSSACAVTGSVALLSEGETYTQIVQSGQLAKDKNTLTMIVYEQGNTMYTAKFDGAKQ